MDEIKNDEAVEVSVEAPTADSVSGPVVDAEVAPSVEEETPAETGMAQTDETAG